MANVSITDSSVLPKSITIVEDGKTLTISETKQPVDIVVDQLTVTESPAALNDISDVEITSIANDQILVYDSTSGKWKNEANSGGGGGAVDSVNGQTGTVVLDTDDIAEDGSPTNKYFTTARVDAHLVGGTGVTYSAGNISIGQPVATTDDVTFNEVTAAEFIGNLRGANLMKAQAGEALTKGDVVYISGISGNTPVVSKADADDSTKMPAVGLANATVSTSANVDVLTFGQITNIDTTQNIGGTWAEGDSLYVNTTAGQLTKTQPTGETSLVQKIAKIEKVHASTGLLLIQGAGRTNATPNLNDGNIFIGNASNYSVSASLDTSVSALGYLKNIVEDTTPELGGNLNAQSNQITAVSKLEVTNTSTDDSILLTTTEDTSTAAPVLTFKRNSASPANGDYLGQLKFKGENDADQEVVYAKVTGKISDVTDTTEDGLLEFALRKAGSNNIGARLTSTSLNLLNGTEMDMGSQQIHNVADPTSNQDAATKAYVDSSSASGISAVVDDTSPQLGGDLDVLARTISSSTNIVRVNDGLQIMAGNSLRFENSAQTQNVTISGTLTTTGYDLKLPTTAPAASQYLTVDAAGQLTFSNVPTVISNNNQLTNGAGYITASSSDALTNKTGNISQWTNDSNYLLNVIEDTTPQLGGQLDPNGNNIHDENRNYTIIGNNNAPSAADYDSFSSSGSRVFGPVIIEEVSNPAVNQRVHSNPVLTKISLDADRNDNNARFRCGYKEAVLQTSGFDVDPTVGFGRGFVGNFYSAKISNDSATTASTVGQHTALLVTPQLDGLTSNVTSQDMRVLEAQPFIASGGTVDNLYGFHYSTNNSGTITNQYSIYGSEANASAYNAGGFQLPIVTVANLSTLPQREGNTAYVNNNTAGTGSVAKCMVFYDGSNWKLAHEPGTTAA